MDNIDVVEEEDETDMMMDELAKIISGSKIEQENFESETEETELDEDDEEYEQDNLDDEDDEDELDDHVIQQTLF